MNYYLITRSIDKKKVGVKDGYVQAEIIESKWSNKKELKRYNDEYVLGVYKTLERIEKGEEVLPPSLEYIKIRPHAIITDFLSFAEAYPGGRYLISDKVKTILSNFNCNCRFYGNVSLYHMIKGLTVIQTCISFP